MRRILSERNLVVILFVMALVFFAFATQETKKMEMIYMDQGAPVSSVLPSTPPAAHSKTVSETNLAVIPAH